MNKKVLVALAAEIRAYYAAASKCRAAGDNDQADRLLTRAAGAEDVVLAVAPQFNDNFDSCRFVEASRPE